MEKPQQQKFKGKRSLPMDVEHRQTGKSEPYLHTIRDKAFGDFKILNTANGWWGDVGKVQRLIDAYKIDANDDEACSYAGISIDMLLYFKELHPDFSKVKHACRQQLGLKAKQALANKIELNPEWYLERRRKDEYSTRAESTGPNGRDLYEGLTNQFKELTEQIANADDRPKEHTSPNDTGVADAGSSGNGNDAGASGDAVNP